MGGGGGGGRSSSTGTGSRGGGGSGGGSKPAKPGPGKPQPDPCPENLPAILIDSAQVLEEVPQIKAGSQLILEADGNSFQVLHKRRSLGWLPAATSAKVRKCADEGVTYSCALVEITAKPLRVEVVLHRK